MKLSCEEAVLSEQVDIVHLKGYGMFRIVKTKDDIRHPANFVI
jgi:hypothetical protein